MLNDTTLFETIDKVAIAIERLKTFCPPEGYYLAFSGGKDSSVILALAKMAAVKYDAHYNMTTIDPPELVHFIKRQHTEVIFEVPKMPFLTRMAQRGFPQRQRRWCCEEYKEQGGSGRKVVTGIRAAESPKRARRKMVESCYKDTTKMYVNPIIDWTDNDVWEFIRQYNIPYCKLYDEGFKRIGCLFCPMAGSQRMIEYKRYPKIADAWIRAFEKIHAKKKSEGKASVDRWANGKDMFMWWIRENRESYNKDQLVLFE